MRNRVKVYYPLRRVKIKNQICIAGRHCVKRTLSYLRKIKCLVCYCQFFMEFDLYDLKLLAKTKIAIMITPRKKCNHYTLTIFWDVFLVTRTRVGRVV